MQKEIYTPMEKVLVSAALLYEEAAANAEKVTDALKLDLLLLEMEEKQGLIDGLPVEAWLS